MKRRGFLGLLASLPFVKVTSAPTVTSEELAKQLSIPEWGSIEGDTILEKYTRNPTIGGSYSSRGTFDLVRPMMISKEN